MSKISVAGILATVVLASLAAMTGPARATYPGANGRLAFGINIAGNTDVYSVRPDGQDLRRLTDAPAFDACPAYSADGQKIAYCSGAGRGPVQIWTMNQDGTNKQQLTHLGGPAVFPDFSPDGTEIAFSAQPAGASTRDIYLVAIDGSGLQQLTSGAGNNTYPAYSPDGSEIAFTSDRTGTWQVWVMNADGSDQTQLTVDALPKDQVPDWSPDGSKIAYIADTTSSPDHGGNGDIWVIDADGENQHPITSGAHDLGTAWSPDGTHIATLDFPSRTVYTLKARDGSDPQAVHPGGLQFVPGWQPGGTATDGQGDG
jgi:Tol biopolymer transport system component